ncbi:chromosomal replication initiator protein DnaA [Patescibacteria group bacterium]|nr:chromosomal replication initiator protein DnaA [Patescibacteria group bacterium]MDL1953072.1 chromosomal replication initiator protein DnaA [Candidatus Uhrbacteria bacterium UHB]RIL00141.1 MAG: chromosomal replication initiator protein DnaA [Candidatus Uhrbacteria bacterium]
MDLQAIWLAALGELELTLSKANFTTWFRNTSISSFDNGRVIIAVPNTFTKAWLEKKYHDAIVKALRHVTSNAVREAHYKVEMRTASDVQHSPPASEPSTGWEPDTSHSPAPQTEPADDAGLNPRYGFDNFIVGKGNELAHAAAMASATNPGEAYNPLFIYGGVGLGKTHLLQAIGQHVLKTRNGAVVRYITCERFTNEFIQAVRGGRVKEFKDRYRNVDVLLVDDIQFLSGKQGTQEEFFHTFNALHQVNKQIVLSSDRSPKDIQSLESRLLSRFEWGMITDISTPDFETRIAILEAKCAGKSYPLNAEILRAIAGTVQSNVRELEGTLNKIIAYHQFKNIQPTMDTVQTLLQSFVPTVQKRSITPRKLLEIVIQYYDITMDDVLGKSREKRFAFPRQVAMYLLREDAKCSYPAIGTHVGDRDHTTAMHACNKILSLLEKDEQTKRDVAIIREKIYSDQAA